MARLIYEAAGGEKEVWIVSDAGYTKSYDISTIEFEQHVQEFLDDALIN